MAGLATPPNSDPAGPTSSPSASSGTTQHDDDGHLDFLRYFDRLYIEAYFGRLEGGDREEFLSMIRALQPEAADHLISNTLEDVVLSDRTIAEFEDFACNRLEIPLDVEDQAFIIGKFMNLEKDDSKRKFWHTIVSDHAPEGLPLPSRDQILGPSYFSQFPDETLLILLRWWHNKPEKPETATIKIPIERDGYIYQCTLPSTVSILDLSLAFTNFFNVAEDKQKIQIGPPLKILRPPFKEDFLYEMCKANTRIKILGPTDDQLVEMHKEHSRRAYSSAVQLRGGGSKSSVAAYRHRDWRKVQDEATYTFHDIRPLTYLPKAERSTRFLERLRDDPGIKASMRKHKFSVPLLTEMNPAEHTTQESKTLGLNRNKGEVIELRLRTDAYDGYRDYKVIRKTLCHELAHCVHSEHDRHFWDLTKQIEGEVEQSDWKHGGHRLTESEFYNPNDTGEAEEHFDHGGWTGGNFVLGTNGESANSSTGLSRREIMARAAEKRTQRKSAPDSSGEASAKEHDGAQQ